MKQTPIQSADLRASVIAVPPFAMEGDGNPSRRENQKLLAWLAGGGVRSFMYGGNANFFHLGREGYVRALDLLAELVPDDAWLLPSMGPDFGKAMDQAPLLAARGFPTAMMLPSSAPTTPQGVAEGARRLADAFGGPIVIYLKSDGYIAPSDLAKLMDEGRIAAIKYAVVRAAPSADPYLEQIVAACGAERVVSGIGERPAIEHWRRFGLRAFTSGSICVAPRSSMALLAALRSGRYDEAERLRALFIPLEDLRDAHSPILVLHSAVDAAGIASTGRIAPFLSNLTDVAILDAVTAAAKVLHQHEHERALRS
jgi:dihydrodipicolinate synthase/N-acetylneuraminate lyase